LSFLIDQRFTALEKLIDAASDKNLDPIMQSNLCKLGSVLICGNLERCIEHLLSERIGKRSAPQVTSFLKAYFKRGSNYDCDQILNLLYRFDTNWGKLFETFVSEHSAIKDGVASCYSVRNSVAHGGTQALGYSVLRQYYEASFYLVLKLEDLLQKN
jgi:hypothetical protein